QPTLVGGRRDLRRFDLPPAAPEDVRVAHRHSDRLEVRVDRRLVREYERLLGTMRDGHDVNVREFRPALAPVRVRDDVMTPDFATRLDFATFGNAPVKERVVARDARSTGRGLHVLEKSRKAANDFSLIQRSRDVKKFVERHLRLSRTRGPR